MTTTRIDLEEMTKIEGHATLRLRVADGVVEHCEVRALEGSRYFEGLLRDRLYNEAAEVSSRICGICSVAHTLCAYLAIENALGVQVTPQTVALRRLLHMGEFIRSHAAHLYFLALPDYLGVSAATSFALDQRGATEYAIQLLRLGNDMVRCIGGRDIHPVSVTVGGMARIPTKKELAELRARLEEMRPAAVFSAHFFNSLTYPVMKDTAERFSLHGQNEYALIRGSIKSATAEFEQRDYGKFISEYQDPANTANFVVREGKSYLVGAVARLANNHEQLLPEARALYDGGIIKDALDNPFMSVPGQALELVQSVDDCIAILDSLEVKQESLASYEIKAGHGIAALEAPRGTLWHEYVLNDKGVITHANIITPTAQNLRSMEESLKYFLPQVAALPREKMVNEAEKLIRSYDPCFSCAAHFLNVEWLDKSGEVESVS